MPHLGREGNILLGLILRDDAHRHAETLKRDLIAFLWHCSPEEAIEFIEEWERNKTYTRTIDSILQREIATCTRVFVKVFEAHDAKKRIQDMYRKPSASQSSK